MKITCPNCGAEDVPLRYGPGKHPKPQIITAHPQAAYLFREAGKGLPYSKKTRLHMVSNCAAGDTVYNP